MSNDPYQKGPYNSLATTKDVANSEDNSLQRIKDAVEGTLKKAELALDKIDDFLKGNASKDEGKNKKQDEDKKQKQDKEEKEEDKREDKEGDKARKAFNERAKKKEEQKEKQEAFKAGSFQSRNPRPEVQRSNVTVNSPNTRPIEMKKKGFKEDVESGSTYYHPFKIFTRMSSSIPPVPEYYVRKGSIVDGTNGGPQIISGLETWQDASAGYVIIEGTVSQPSLEVSSFSVQIVADGISANEVDTTPQGSVRLLLGKITIADENATAWQAWSSSARCTRAFLNGKMVRVFESAPTHQDHI